MSKTAIRIAIEQISQLNCDFQSVTDAEMISREEVLNILTSLIDQERDIIETAFDEGGEDMANGEFGGTSEYCTGSTYFIKNFAEN